MAAEDLFSQMGQLFRNKTPEGNVQVFMLHRYLASERAWAPLAKELSVARDDRMTVEIWRSALPFYAKAPYLKYPAPKKVLAAAEIIKKIADAECYTIPEAETFFLLLDQMGYGDELFSYYGIDPKTDKGVVRFGEKKK